MMQEIVVYAVGAAVAVVIVVRIVRALTKPKSPCCGCGRTDCEWRKPKK